MFQVGDRVAPTEQIVKLGLPDIHRGSWYIVDDTRLVQQETHTESCPGKIFIEDSGDIETCLGECSGGLSETVQLIHLEGFQKTRWFTCLLFTLAKLQPAHSRS